MKKKTNNRRQFLRNSSLLALSAAVLPATGRANPKQGQGATPEVTCDPTTLDYYGAGPFYTPNAPFLESGQLAATNAPGQRLILSGVVRNLDCSQVIPDTLIDIWHADDSGAYDNSGFNMRGQTHSNGQGFYLFETILPGKYLNGNQYRPSHIHFRITPPGFDTLITQLYFAGDTDIPNDAAASITSGTYDATERIVPLVENSDGKLEGTWDIMVNGEGIETGVKDLHLETGMLYRLSPNPAMDEVEIRYGVFRKAMVGIQVYDLQGHLVADLERRELTPAKYVAVWRPEGALPNGYYFVSLKVNDLQVHYEKILLRR